MTPIRLTLELTPTGRYRAMLGAKLLVTSREPFYSAARVLLAEGLDPETVLEAQHKGSPIVAMRAKLGEAARWTVIESDEGGLQRRLWKPHPLAEKRRQDAAQSNPRTLENEREAERGTRMGSEP